MVNEDQTVLFDLAKIGRKKNYNCPCLEVHTDRTNVENIHNTFLKDSILF